MVVSVPVEFLLHAYGNLLLWMPWMILFLMMVPIAYRRGVQDGRIHPDDSDDDKWANSQPLARLVNRALAPSDHVGTAAVGDLQTGRRLFER